MNTGANAELRITFSKPRLIIREDSTERVAAGVQMAYELDGVCVEESEVFAFVVPIGLLEADDIKWYLESYYIWPVGLFKERAERIEHNLSQWGGQLLESLIANVSTQAIFQQWLQASEAHEPVLSLQVLPEATAESNTAASRLLGLPWELLYHQQQHLVDRQPPIRIRRNLPDVPEQPAHRLEQTGIIRILAASPRPLESGYIDHRISIKPLIEAIEDLGDRAELVRVHPPTIEQLQYELQQAERISKPFHVVHFDGHGVFDIKTGRGALCFEHQLDNDKLLPEFVKRVYADELAALLSQHQIPLVFLEACQSGQSEDDPNASVAAALLQAGVSSVVAMSHSVLVETARRFVRSFYQQLASGQRIGTAVLTGRQSLMEDHDRINIAGAGMLQMQDWFVPLLYQREGDPRLFEAALQVSEIEKPALRLGDLPDTPLHAFIGRSLELLKLERLLELRPYAVIRGMGGQGKTALAVELAYWLVQSRRFARCAFVSVEQYTHENAVIEVLLQQLVNAKHNLAAEYGNDVDKALSAIRETLEQNRTLIVVDNMESLLADAENKQAVLDVLARLPEAKLLFTTRESLPEPFQRKVCEIELDALSLNDAKALVMRVMNHEGLELRHDDMGNTPEAVDDLVNAVGCHARALMLLARELAQRGVAATTENVREIMVELEQRHPGERELSLFANVELSLRRLSPEVRGQIGGLAVFHGGVNRWTLKSVLNVDAENIRAIERQLVVVGLADVISEYGYIRLEPALPAYLDLTLNHKQRAIYQQRYQEAIGRLVSFLYQQIFKDTKQAFGLAQLEIPNLLIYLKILIAASQATKSEVGTGAKKVRRVEQLLANLNKPQILEQVVVWRELIGQNLGDWSHARFEHERMFIERLLDQDNKKRASALAQNLLKQCLKHGIRAYTEAASDLAMANILYGRALRKSGEAEQALPYLKQAQQSFGSFGKDGARMAMSALLEQGNCLRILGKLEAAETAYKEYLHWVKKQGDRRSISTGINQLATVHLKQKRYHDALQRYQEALVLFQQLGEIGAIATIKHQIGITYRKLRNFTQAEQALREALSIEVQRGHCAGEASSMAELGNLYDAWNRSAQATGFYRKAITNYVALGDMRREGSVRNNIAHVLIKLKRYDEARSELLRTIECKQSCGYNELWYTWALLHNLEKANGDQTAAIAARQKAVNSYLEYRKNGGENHSREGYLASKVLCAIQQKDTAEVKQQIKQKLEIWNRPHFLSKLLAIIAGDRNIALAEDKSLQYDEVAELILLLEQLEN